MAYNTKRAARMAQLSVADLKRRADSGSLTSAAAIYALLHTHGIRHVVRKG